jgi:hypothetical protein
VGLIFLVAVLSATGMHIYDMEMMHRARGTSPDTHSGPWGDLLEWNIRTEQPLEYSGFENIDRNGPFWNFGNLTSPQIRNLLIQSGCTEDQADGLISSRVPSPSGDLILKPDDEFLLSLNPEVRSKLYLTLSRNPNNHLQATPYFIAGGDPSVLFDVGHDSNNKAIALIKKLLYTRNGYPYFSDPEVILRHLPSKQEQEEFLQSLTSQNTVLLRLLVRPDSDIDKSINYWTLSLNGVRMKDLRPMLESQKRLPEGGSISILYLLPPLAREKLFTSPLPPRPGEKILPDCHWTALNFFNPVPDPRMSDNDYASRFIQEHYSEIASPGVPGDLILLLDDQNRVVHSSVYIADDIVFTKNGLNYAQPWVLMHVKDMVGSFSAIDPMKLAYYRRNQF